MLCRRGNDGEPIQWTTILGVHVVGTMCRRRAVMQLYHASCTASQPRFTLAGFPVVLCSSSDNNKSLLKDIPDMYLKTTLRHYPDLYAS